MQTKCITAASGTAKAWGASETLWLDEQVQVERIRVRPGGFCSDHLHHHKDNSFVVYRGTLLVRVLTVEGWIDRSLSQGENILIPPLIRHQLLALSEVVAVEIYRAAVLGEMIDPDDICRFTCGGQLMDAPVTWSCVVP